MPSTLTREEARRLMLGVWDTDRRRGDGARFARLRLHRDGRFVAVALDRRTVVFGSWWMEHVRVEAPTAPHRLHLRFDGRRGPDVAYALESIDRSHDAVELVAVDNSGQRSAIARPLPINARLVGRWTLVSRPSLEPYALTHLELAPDGTFTSRLTGGVRRHGRWGIVVDVVGTLRTLVLDPDDAVLPRDVIPLACHGERIVLDDTAGGRAIEFVRESLDAQSRALLGHWRRIDHPAGPGEELVLRADGTCARRDRPGSPLMTGAWKFTRDPVPAGALAGELAMTLDRRVLPLTSERWHVELRTQRGAVLVMRGGQVRTYRRLFR